MERVAIIERYEDEISDALRENYITQYGEQIIDPIDVEFGSLCYMMSHRRQGDNSVFMIYIPDENDRERIKFLHGCRNKLAHVTCCDPEEVSRLIDGDR